MKHRITSYNVCYTKLLRDKKKIESVSEITLTLLIEPAEPSLANQDLINAQLDNQEVEAYLDLTLTKTIDGVEEEITQISKPVKIEIELTDALKEKAENNYSFSVIQIANDNSLQIV